MVKNSETVYNLPLAMFKPLSSHSLPTPVSDLAYCYYQLNIQCNV